jgi:hypothetical protein
MADLAAPRRAHAFRQKAYELVEAAKREDDRHRRLYMLDLARNYLHVANEIAPLPPTEPQIFR